MSVTQLSVFIENKPGHLEQILETLGQGGINLIALTVAETADFGVLRMILPDPAKAADLLRSRQITCSATEVLAVELDDCPGALRETLKTFSKRNLNIEYMYAFAEKHKDKAVMIFRFDNMDEAKKAVQQAGYRILQQSDLGDH
ncbi:MAG: amino acid-binding protein [Phycisphaerae bacterium]|nr:amino acid-binding protein [Phycisphaerae bacterium]